ncbi:hypothetical protein TSAR_014361, partial [Trichomalopsis sarcophagae]
ETDKKHTVCTDTKNSPKQNRDKYIQCQHFDTNTKGVMGILNGGIGNTQFNKLLSDLNIPELNWKAYKGHENVKSRQCH